MVSQVSEQGVRAATVGVHPPLVVSVLFGESDPAAEPGDHVPPGYFADLNLDQVIDTVTAGRAEYDLRPFFTTPLDSLESVQFRQAVFADLDGRPVLNHLTAFAERMRRMRRQLALAGTVRFVLQRRAWFLAAVQEYGQAVAELADELGHAEITSQGLVGVRDYLRWYVDSGPYAAVVAEAGRVQTGLAGVRFCLDVGDGRVTVTRYDDQVDYTERVQDSFRRFRQGAVKSYLVDISNSGQINQVEAAVLELVARLYPQEFGALAAFCAEHGDFLDATVAGFDRQVQFYLAFLEFAAPLRAAGLSLCYPTVSGSKQIAAQATYDIALADRLVRAHTPVVCNDLNLAGAQRLFVVTGANQGGKTTFARTVGQLHYLAALGCPVPGRVAQLFLPDRIFTHFDRQENLADLRGKLEDDLTRVHDILTHATPNSLVIMNEVFTSTTLADALTLGRRVVGQLIERDLLGVYVTFVDELASIGPTVVSMVATVDPLDPATRTYQVVRRRADGLAYAVAIARKYRLTRQDLTQRLSR